MMKACVSICAVAVALCAVNASLTARTLDRRTFFTFNEPVTVPGVTLPPGRYLFRIANTDSGGNVVQILDDDSRRSYALLLSIPAERPDATAEPELSFMETRRGTPVAVKTWWQPGEKRGYEFIYPEGQALRLASGAGGPVLRTTATHPRAIGQSTDRESTLPSRSGAEMAAQEQPATLVQSESAQGEGTSPTSNADTPAALSRQAERTALPSTASLIPLLSILGAAAIGVGLWLSRKA